ncbi:MAG: sugar phosphate isomerase/epimerase [Planctomycetes bacterium]|nr:sugar phosphate isomerase/epimerase [Planctomycetota bacterium]
MNRRDFVVSAAATLALPHLGRFARLREAEPKIRFAVKYGMVDEGATVLEKFKLVKELGFHGIEMDSPSNLDRSEVIAARDETRLTIHGVVDSVHWRKPFSHPDAEVRAEGVAALETAVRDCKAYGGTTVLVVPAVVNKDVSYAEAWERSTREIKRVLPLCEELGIRIAFENVWNGFLLSPLEAARYVDSFESSLVGWYFDVGNIVNYGWPRHWIEALGNRIFKVDVKGFSRKRRNDQGLWKGFGVEIGDEQDDGNWDEVRAALGKLGYDSWATAEVGGGGRERLADIKARMDRVLANPLSAK